MSEVVIITFPPIFTSRSSALSRSSLLNLVTPDLDVIKAFQRELRSLPKGETIPMPVTTTLLIITDSYYISLLG